MFYTTEDIAALKTTFSLDHSQTPSHAHREQLTDAYGDKLEINRLLTRSLVSFQANKAEPLYRWFKYKEGFSSAFVRYVLEQFGRPHSGQVVLDPFAGTGTTVTTSVQQGFNAIGIELLSPGILAAEARIASRQIQPGQLEKLIDQLRHTDFADPTVEAKFFFQHLTITKGAFSNKTEIAIAKANQFIHAQCRQETLRAVLRFAVMSILEEVSFTRKDGQYLRWDYRSHRQLKSKFNKGLIHDFKSRFLEKLTMMKADIEAMDSARVQNEHRMISGSCLEKLHDLPASSVDLIITSPPYCNRYDYTRTYALELAYSGVDNQAIKALRQTLLSATVENKSKHHHLRTQFERLAKSSVFEKVVETYRNQPALNEVLASLHIHREQLNNKNIPIMVGNYFFEMNFVIHELARVLKPGGKVVMVNDNVRYNGDEVPVDLILSEFAKAAGLGVDVIWVLAKGKGNSSQQMGTHGRKEMRKCVYVWSK